MTCEECEEILLDSENRASRKSWMSSVSVLNLAKQHAESCSACAAKMSEVSRLETVLDELRRSTIRIEVPATIESNLLDEFRQQEAWRAPYGPSTFRWRLVWGAAAALALVAALVFYAELRARPSVTVVEARTEHSAQQSPSLLHSGAGSDQRSIENHYSGADRPGLASANTDRAATRTTRPEKPAWRESISPPRDEFSLNGGGNVVRVTLPLASLSAMGVPIYPELSDRRVTADVARDAFGAVIAIRLVETTPSTN
jgi:hypothetical protein